MKTSAFITSASLGLLAGSWLVFGAHLLGGCSPAVSTATERSLCYVAADHRAQLSVDAKCPPDAGAFSKCPAKADILKQLQTDQEACP